MPGHSPTPNASHEVDIVQVVLSFRSPKPAPKKDTSKGGKKSASPKSKVETKSKETSFTFEPSEENYLDFLSELLKVHGHVKYTPVKKHTQYNIKVLIAKKSVCLQWLSIALFLP